MRDHPVLSVKKEEPKSGRTWTKWKGLQVQGMDSAEHVDGKVGDDRSRGGSADPVNDSDSVGFLSFTPLFHRFFGRSVLEQGQSRAFPCCTDHTKKSAPLEKPREKCFYFFKINIQNLNFGHKLKAEKSNNYCSKYLPPLPCTSQSRTGTFCTHHHVYVHVVPRPPPRP